MIFSYIMVTFAFLQVKRNCADSPFWRGVWGPVAEAGTGSLRFPAPHTAATPSRWAPSVPDETVTANKIWKQAIKTEKMSSHTVKYK